MYKCNNCKDIGVVCENHMDRPWDGNSNHEDACGCGPGVNCPVCELRRVRHPRMAKLDSIHPGISFNFSAKMEFDFSYGTMRTNYSLSAYCYDGTSASTAFCINPGDDKDAIFKEKAADLAEILT